MPSLISFGGANPRSLSIVSRSSFAHMLFDVALFDAASISRASAAAAAANADPANSPPKDTISARTAASTSPATGKPGDNGFLGILHPPPSGRTVAMTMLRPAVTRTVEIIMA